MSTAETVFWLAVYILGIVAFVNFLLEEDKDPQPQDQDPITEARDPLDECSCNRM